MTESNRHLHHATLDLFRLQGGEEDKTPDQGHIHSSVSTFCMKMTQERFALAYSLFTVIFVDTRLQMFGY